MPKRKPPAPARKPTPPIDEQIRRDDLKRIRHARRLEQTIRREARALLRDIQNASSAISALSITVEQRRRERGIGAPAPASSVERAS